MHNSISFITTCKGRLHHIKQTLPLLCQENPDQIIVVDYDCPDKVGDWVKANFPQVKVAYYNDGQAFNLSRARNFGARHASGQWLCFIDADVKVSPGFLSWLRENVSEGHFYRAEPINGKRDMETWGTSVCDEKSFSEIEGYDEFYRGWGGEDHDLYYKLERLGCREKSFPSSFVEAISHGDEERLTFFDVKDRLVQNFENRLYLSAKRTCMEFSNTRGELPLEMRSAIYDRLHSPIMRWIKGGLKSNVDVVIETKKKRKRIDYSLSLPDFRLETELRITYRVRSNRARRAKTRFKNLRNRLKEIFRGSQTRQPQ